MSADDMRNVINNLTKKNQLYEENINSQKEEILKLKDLLNNSEKE
jgi:hypothetical protein